MNYTTIRAKKTSYGGGRSLDSIKYIVIHYTGGTKDTAKNEGDYFAHSNTRSAGAHWFVDQQGEIVLSVPMALTAWSVGGKKYSGTKGAAYYGKCTNSNSVSIELCAIADKAPSDAMIKSTRELVAYIQSVCRNAETIIRHYDVTGKSCPATMTGTNNALWNSFKAAISGTATMVSHTTTSTPVNTGRPEDVSMTTIKNGSKGHAVKVWQAVLGNVSIDGIFGSGTKKATESFQRAKGLTADGIVGKNTWKKGLESV